MPIPEPGLYRPSRLTKQQKTAHMRQIYGVEEMPEQLSHEEVARMRQILADHDEQQPIRTIDLNNPPKEPYRFAEFPKMVYDHANSRPGSIVCRKVANADALAMAIEDGWTVDAPSFGSWEETPLSAQYRNEADQAQTRIDAENAKRGRARREVAAA